MTENQLSTQPYKGTRDFYPEDMQMRSWMFDHLRQVIGSYGYQEYDGPMLESFDLYAAKTGDEIVNEQLYSFEDRGGRKVAMRPEMTPTLARMVAAKGSSLQKPLRWFSLPNLWRYERPQRGRLREHWQLNVDLLGIEGVEAEVEIIQVAIDMMRGFGASPVDFEIQINHRQLMNDLFEQVLKLNPEQTKAVARAIDKRAKIAPEAFQNLLKEANCSESQISDLESFLVSPLLEIGKICGESAGYKDLIRFFDTVNAMGLGPVCRFNTSIMRGFDYYTGMVFELYDKHPDNRRALFGGGRYDNLVGMFGNSPMPGVGFGMGDVTLMDFLKLHGLLPELQSHVEILVGLFNAEMVVPSQQLARELRLAGFKVETVLKAQKLGKQFEFANKRGIPLVILQGPDEVLLEEVSIKDLRTGQQENVLIEKLVEWIQARLNP
jgi:histidyl-tRNA synthetase